MTGRNDSLREDRDFAGGGGVVFKSLCASHRMPIAKLRGDVDGKVASSGQWARFTPTDYVRLMTKAAVEAGYPRQRYLKLARSVLETFFVAPLRQRGPA